MAPPDGAAVSHDAMGLTQRDLLLEMREDIKALKATVDAIEAIGKPRPDRIAQATNEKPRPAATTLEGISARWSDPH